MAIAAAHLYVFLPRTEVESFNEVELKVFSRFIHGMIVFHFGEACQARAFPRMVVITRGAGRQARMQPPAKCFGPTTLTVLWKVGKSFRWNEEYQQSDIEPISACLIINGFKERATCRCI